MLPVKSQWSGGGANRVSMDYWFKASGVSVLHQWNILNTSTCGMLVEQIEFEWTCSLVLVMCQRYVSDVPVKCQWSI